MADFAGTVEETLGDMKRGIDNILHKHAYTEKKPHVVLDWNNFWDSRVDTVEEIAHNVDPFSLPPKQTTSQKSSKQTLPIRIDDGIRKVDVVTHSQFKASQRKKALGVVGSQLPDDQLEELKQGDFVIVQRTSEHSPWYAHPLIIGEIHKDISLSLIHI